MASRLFYTDHHVLPLPAGHKFPIEKYRLLREMLERDGEFVLERAPLASEDVIELAHEREYVRAFVDGTLEPAAMRRIGFPWSKGLVQRTLASVGSTLAATVEALETGWGGTLAGGTHHAFAREGSGFCVFNDVAVAIRWLEREYRAPGGEPRELGRADGLVARGRKDGRARYRRFAVIDLDVHQGDGTAHIFRDDPSVLTLSVHCKNNFPLRKQTSKIDVELDAGVGDKEYLGVLEAVLPQVWEFEPDFVFYQSGVDGLASDVLGHLELTHPGLMERDRMVMRGVRSLGVPFVVTLGGGYSRPVELTAEAHANTFRVAREIFGAGEELRAASNE
jgi:acetoin utilization deacetylase AcuC-like enzyme